MPACMYTYVHIPIYTHLYIYIIHIVYIYNIVLFIIVYTIYIKYGFSDQYLSVQIELYLTSKL